MTQREVRATVGAELTAAIAENDAIADVLRGTLQQHDEWNTALDGVKRLAHYHKQALEAIYNIVHQSGLNDMAEILEALTAFRGAMKPFADAALDGDVIASLSDTELAVMTTDDEDRVKQAVFIEIGDDETLSVKHLRNAAEVYAKFERAGDE